VADSQFMGKLTLDVCLRFMAQVEGLHPSMPSSSWLTGENFGFDSQPLIVAKNVESLSLNQTIDKFSVAELKLPAYQILFNGRTG
jgi:hypothetical protein